MKRTGIILSLILIFTACEREVIIELPPYKQKMVLNGVIDNITPVNLKVSYSVAALTTDDPDYLEDALVLLYANGVLADTLDYNSFDRRYNSFVVPVSGVRYTVKVAHSKFDQIEASTTLPGNSFNTTAEFKDSTGQDSLGAWVGTITIRFKDDPSENNYFRVNYLYNNQGTWNRINYQTDDPSLLEGEEEPDGSIIFDDLLFNGKEKEIKVTVPSYNATGSPKFIIDFSILSAEYYKYKASLQKFHESGNSFFSEPVFVYTNVTNGLGIFAGQISLKDTIK